jgi:hypothetical protein
MERELITATQTPHLLCFFLACPIILTLSEVLRKRLAKAIKHSLEISNISSFCLSDLSRALLKYFFDYASSSSTSSTI